MLGSSAVNMDSNDFFPYMGVALNSSIFIDIFDVYMLLLVTV